MTNIEGLYPRKQEYNTDFFIQIFKLLIIYQQGFLLVNAIEEPHLLCPVLISWFWSSNEG